MLKRILPVIILLLLSTGCKNSQTVNTSTFPIKSDVLFEKAFNTKNPPELILDVENCNITIVSQDKAEVKFSVRNAAAKTENEKLADNKIDIAQIDNKIVCKSIRGKDEKIKVNISNITLSIPKSIASLQIKLDKATLDVRDDLRCQFLIEAGTCNVKIGRLVGSVIAKIAKGNFEISSGRLSAAECYIVNEGNINIKSELDKAGKYMFETNKGNIDLQLPENIKASFESAGIVEVNDFVQQDSDISVLLKSRLGRISLRKAVF